MDWLSHLLGIVGHDCCSVFPCFSNLDGFEVIPRNFIHCPQGDWYFLTMRRGAGLLGGEPQKKSTVFLTAPQGLSGQPAPWLWMLALATWLGGLWGLFAAATPPAPAALWACVMPTVKAGLCSLSRGQNIYRDYLESFFKTHVGIVLYALHIYGQPVI